MYQRLAAVRDAAGIAELVEELHDRYGDIPQAVLNLIEVAKFRNHARQAGLHDVTLQGNLIRFGPVDLPDSKVLRLNRLYPKSLVKPQLRTILVPRPATRPIGGQPLRDQELLQWCTPVDRRRDRRTDRGTGVTTTKAEGDSVSRGRKFGALGAAVAPVLLAGGCAAGTHPGAAAVVGDTEISIGDVDKTSRAVVATRSASRSRPGDAQRAGQQRARPAGPPTSAR